MRKNNVQRSNTASKRGLKVQKRRMKKKAKEDQHVAWLWKKIQGGMQLKLEMYDDALQLTRPTMTRRILARLVSLQELNK